MEAKYSAFFVLISSIKHCAWHIEGNKVVLSGQMDDRLENEYRWSRKCELVPSGGKYR